MREVLNYKSKKISKKNYASFSNFISQIAKFIYSVLKLFTGFAMAAFIAWKLTVNSAMRIAINAANAKIHQSMLTL